jgi:hypothetical protein
MLNTKPRALAIFTAFAISLISLVTLTIPLAPPASAHGTWPSATSTGYGISPFTSTLNSSIGDQVFTSVCGSPPCYHNLTNEHIQGKVVVGTGHVVAVVNSWIEHDNDSIAVETTGTGSAQVDWTTISGSFINAAVGRNLSMDHDDISGITATGIALHARGNLQNSWLHDFATSSMYPEHGVLLFDVWQYCQLVNVPDGCNNPGGVSGFTTTVYHNFIQLDGNVWSALYAAPAYGTNPTGANWQINDNFFVGGASETVHIADPNGDLQFLNASRNHVMTSTSETVADYDVACGWEWDNYSTASAQSAPLGTAC